MSNYVEDTAAEMVQDPETEYPASTTAWSLEIEDSREILCKRCRGTGLTYIAGLETDCLVCEGMGSVLI